MTSSTLIAAAWNALFALGSLLVAFGFWLAWRPLGFIVGGLALCVLGYGGGLEQMRERVRGR